PGTAFSPLLVLTEAQADLASLRLTLEGDGLRVAVVLDLDEHGVLHADAALTNVGEGSYRLEALNIALPAPDRAAEALDFTGRWGKEKQEQRRPIQQGEWIHPGRHGRTGHDGAGLLVVGTSGFGFGHGEAWGVHLAWSGDQEQRVERIG
ncbi:glycoside hydrolase family 36 N-terminal domain-containing protein, partial [Mesorhizobium japonicum]|uniref:glycoside hydrolase family 36 N-terminal domain-containing protein n=1 Tax=Mesorhizobium japonicum TaxID=2066070 RepID=UPI003B5A91B7